MIELLRLRESERYATADDAVPPAHLLNAAVEEIKN